MKKTYCIIASIIFLFSLFLVPLCILLTPDRDFSENENRYLAQAPEASIKNILSGKFMSDTEKYMDDQFPLRDLWTAAKSELLLLSGRRDINGVYWGKDKYLIERWDEKDFDEALLRQNLAAVEAFGENHPDMPLSLMLVPTAGIILKDKLPENAPIFDQSLAFDTACEEFSGGRLIDLRETFTAQKDSALYYHSDHHWTSYGAFLAYSRWCEGQGLSVSADDFEIETVTDAFRGSLYSKVLSPRCAYDSIELYHRLRQCGYTVSFNSGRTESDSVYALESLSGKDKYKVFLNGNHPELTISTDTDNGKRLLIFKDSFANAFIPFLLNDYESIHVIDPRYYSGDLEQYISENQITECLFLYNIKNFCESDELSVLF